MEAFCPLTVALAYLWFLMSATLACVIIDDDEVSRLTLERYIAQSDDLALTASFADPLQALAYLKMVTELDVLFLDVQMPVLTGLELLRLVPNPPAVILTTSRPDFAVEAFELRVLDYLVKPVEFVRFRQAVDRVQQRLISNAKPAASLAPPADTRRALPSPLLAPAIFVKTSSRIVRVPLADILYIEAVASYAVVVTKAQQLLSNQSIKDFSERLPVEQFARVHRSYIINRQQIESIEDNIINLAGGRTVPVGKTYLSEFLEGLKGLAG